MTHEREPSFGSAERPNTLLNWASLDKLLKERWNAGCVYRGGNRRHYAVAHPAGGSFQVEIALNPKWCSIAMDRINTSNHPAEAEEWLKTNVHPVIREAWESGYKRGGGVWPAGRSAFTMAKPIPRDKLVSVLIPWVDRELEWDEPLRYPR